MYNPCTCACVTHSLSAAADFEMRNEDNSPPQRRTRTAAAGVIFSPSQHDCQCPDWRPTDRPREEARKLILKKFQDKEWMRRPRHEARRKRYKATFWTIGVFGDAIPLPSLRLVCPHFFCHADDFYAALVFAQSLPRPHRFGFPPRLKPPSLPSPNLMAIISCQ